jgi:WD40 repeat protein
VWDVNSGKSISDQFESHSRRIAEAAFVSAGSVIVTAGADNTVRTWHPTTGKQLSNLHIKGDLYRRCGVSRDGQFLCWAFAKSHPERMETVGVVQIVELSTGKVLREISVPHDITAATISDAGDLLAIAVSNAYPFPYAVAGQKRQPNREIHVVNIRSGKKVVTLASQGANAFAMQFAQDGQTLLSAAEGNGIRTWDLDRGHERAAVKLAVNGQYPVGQFSPDGTTLVTSTRDAVQIWDVLQGTERFRLQVPNTLGSNICISQDGTMMATAGVQISLTAEVFDESIHLWDLKTGRELLKLGPEDAAVSTMAFSDDGRTLVTGTEMGTALVWDVSAAYRKD